MVAGVLREDERVQAIDVPRFTLVGILTRIAAGLAVILILIAVFVVLWRALHPVNRHALTGLFVKRVHCRAKPIT